MAKLRSNFTLAAGDSELFEKIPTENGYLNSKSLNQNKNGYIRNGYTKNGIPRRHVKVNNIFYFHFLVFL